MLRIFLFGQPRLLWHNQPYRFVARPRVLPLFAYLLLHRAAPVTRDTLAFTLWTDDTEADARANLRRHLNYLRQALPVQDTPWLVQENQTVQWNTAVAYWLDVEAFETACAHSKTLADAIPLYTGELLASADADWLVPERERLRTLYENALEQLVNQARAQREFVTAIQYAQQLAQHDPLREDAARQLIALRYEAGDRAGALETFARFTERLHTELGVEPMPETLLLYENVRRNENIHPEGHSYGETAASAKPFADQAPLHMPLVGRDVEMEQLRTRWNRAAEGAGGLLLLGGEAGIGKTRLATELVHLAQGQGARVLTGNTAFPEGYSYQALLEALRAALPLLRNTKIETQTLAVVSRVLPEIRTRFPDVPPLVALEPARERTRLFQALTHMLEVLAQPRPLLIILEDVHWAGADTFALLEGIAPTLASARILVILTFREEETLRAHPLRQLRRRLPLEAIALGRLDKEAVTQLAAAVSPDAMRAQALFQASEGNPLFIQQWLMEANKEIQDTEWMPHALEEIIARRAARVSPQAQIVAQAASVLGDAFSPELVQELIGWNERQTLDALGALLDHQLIGAGLSPRGEYAFTHHLVRAALYNQIPPADRKRRHHRAARVMEETYGTQLDEYAVELAGHYERGGDGEPAAEYYLRAARRSEAVYAEQDALSYTTRALELAVTAALRARVSALAETLYARRGEREPQRAMLETMRALADELRDDQARWETLERTIRYHRALGERDAEAATIILLENSAQGIWHARALRHRAAHETLRGEYVAARKHALAAQRAFADADDAAGQAECFCMLAEIAAHQGQLNELQAFVERATSFAASSGNQSLLVETLRAGSVTAFVRGDYAAAHTFAAQMLTLTRRILDREGEADAHWRLANAATRLFRVREAQTHFDAAALLFEQIGKTQGRAAVLLNRGSLHARLGEWSAAQDSFQAALALFQTLDDLRGQGIALINLAYNTYFAGEYAQTLDYAQRAQDVGLALEHPTMQANALVLQGWALREQGKLQASIVLQEQSLTIRRRLDPSDDLLTDYRDLALTWLRAGSLPDAQALIVEMLAAYESIQPNVTEAHTIFWAAAVVARAAGDAAGAAQFLARAYELVQTRAAELPDAALRAAFLQIPYHRAICRAFEADAWDNAPPV